MAAFMPALAIVLALLALVAPYLWNRHPLSSTGASVRAAIDFLPEGICLSRSDGTPVLVNAQMNSIATRLTGHTIVNAAAFWNEVLPRASTADGQGPMPSGTGMIAVGLEDGRTLQLAKLHLGGEDRFIQITASDITEFASYEAQLRRSNEALLGQIDRQRSLLDDVARINRGKELLSYKMHAHNMLGDCLLMTQRFLHHEEMDAQDRMGLLDAWQTIIDSLSDEGQVGDRRGSPQKQELDKVAGMIGCRIEYQGATPSDEVLPAFYSLVREALANAVRHARATQLTVRTTRNGPGLHVEISDNGLCSCGEPLLEGVGLGSLRMKLEEVGATLEIVSDGGVVLIADFPVTECEGA